MKVFFSIVLICAISSGAVIAQVKVGDPTRPVYAAGGGETGSGSSESLDGKTEIPPLVQLVYSKSRQIAMFGDEFVRAGDESAFGRILKIERDRVIIENDDGIVDVLLYGDPDVDETDETEVLAE